MSREVARIDAGKGLWAAAHTMLRDGVSSLAVTEDGRLIGIVNRLDLYADIEAIELSEWFLC